MTDMVDQVAMPGMGLYVPAAAIAPTAIAGIPTPLPF